MVIDSISTGATALPLAVSNRFANGCADKEWNCKTETKNTIPKNVTFMCLFRLFLIKHKSNFNLD